jgi:hypothetical protein
MEHTDSYEIKQTKTNLVAITSQEAASTGEVSAYFYG